MKRKSSKDSSVPKQDNGLDESSKVTESELKDPELDITDSKSSTSANQNLKLFSIFSNQRNG